MTNSCRSMPLVLSQCVAAPGPIGQIDALRHDAFQAEAAGVLEHRRPVLRQMLAEANGRAGGQPRDDLLQQRLAVEQRRLRSDRTLRNRAGRTRSSGSGRCRPALRSACSSVKLGMPAVSSTTISPSISAELEPELLQRGGDARKPRGPVEPLAREQLDLAAVDARLHAVAVVLDLVHPFRAARRLVGLLRQARLEEGRQDALARAAHACPDRAAAILRAADHLGAAGVVLAQLAERGELLGGAAAETARSSPRR